MTDDLETLPEGEVPANVGPEPTDEELEEGADDPAEDDPTTAPVDPENTEGGG